MRGRWAVGLLLLVPGAGCDDVIFGELPEPPLSQTGYAGVTEVFDTYCLDCHSATAALGQLDLETDPYSSLVGVPCSDGSMPLVDPGNLDTSLLYLKLTESAPPVGGPMPPTGALSQQATDIVKDWIADGAPKQ